MKMKILEYVESRMSFIAPNLSHVVGPTVAAKLMGEEYSHSYCFVPLMSMLSYTYQYFIYICNANSKWSHTSAQERSNYNHAIVVSLSASFYSGLLASLCATVPIHIYIVIGESCRMYRVLLVNESWGFGFCKIACKGSVTYVHVCTCTCTCIGK